MTTSPNIPEAPESSDAPSFATASRLVAFGGGVYWMMNLIGYVCGTQNTLFSHFIATPAFFAVEIALEVALVAIAVACGRKISGRFVQRLLAGGVVVGFLVFLLMEATGLTATSAGSLAANLALVVGRVCTLLLWGLCFTSLERHDAERTALAALLLALTLYLVFLILPIGNMALTHLSYVLVAATALPILAGRRSFATERRDGPANARVLAPFYASRLFFGACQGAIAFLAVDGLNALDGRSRVVMAGALIVMSVFVWTQNRNPQANTALLRLAPPFACGVIVCPLAGLYDIETVILTCTSCFVWMSWSILHSVQLSTLKLQTGLDDCTLAFTEKGVYILGLAGALAVLTAIPGLADVALADDDVRIAAIVIIAFSAVMVACYLLTRVVDEKATERIIDEAEALREQQLEPVFEKLACDFGLTARELDVVRLLAKGRTRPVICEELCISEGTYRSHINRIYKKLDIHSRDELLDLIERTTREYVAR